MNYKKLDVSFKDRLIFLFTGLLNEKYIPQNEIIKTVTIDSQSSIINNIEENFAVKEEKLDIPFFDLDTTKVKSNLMR